MEKIGSVFSKVGLDFCLFIHGGTLIYILIGFHLWFLPAFFMITSSNLILNDALFFSVCMYLCITNFNCCYIFEKTMMYQNTHNLVVFDSIVKTENETIKKS